MKDDIKFYVGIELSQELMLFKPMKEYLDSYQTIKKVCSDFDNEIEAFKQIIVRKHRKEAIEYRAKVIDQIGETSKNDLSDTSVIIASVLSQIASDLWATGFEPFGEWGVDLIDAWGETPIINHDIVKKILG